MQTFPPSLGFQPHATRHTHKIMCLRLRSCCCGCTVQVGAKFVAVVGIVGCLFVVIYSVAVSGSVKVIAAAIIGAFVNALLLHGIR